MVGDDLSGGRKWEEDIYWSRFQSVQFFHTLSSSYDHQLAVPRKFAKNLREKLAGAVYLKGPSGDVWNVEVIASGDVLIFKRGWKEFIEDHSLGKNDLLIFKYNGDLRFDVSMFDKESSCEKESSYFVRKSEHKDASNGCKRKGTFSESFEFANESSHDVVDCVPFEKPRTDAVITSKPTDAATTSNPTDVAIIPKLIGHECPQAVESKNVSSGCNRKGTDIVEVKNEPSHDVLVCVPSKWPRSDAAITSKPADDAITSNPANVATTSKPIGHEHPQAGKNQSSSKKISGLQLLSNRRAVTIQEREKALQLAHSASTERSFMVIMQPSSVYKTFYLSLPAEWTKKHLPQRSRKTILRTEERNWEAIFRRKPSYSSCGGIKVGWRKFVLDNFLEESDVLLFKPAEKTPEAIVLDVSIFRVVDEIIPPSPVMTPAYSANGKGRNRSLATYLSPSFLGQRIKKESHDN